MKFKIKINSNSFSYLRRYLSQLKKILPNSTADLYMLADDDHIKFCTLPGLGSQIIVQQQLTNKYILEEQQIESKRLKNEIIIQFLDFGQFSNYISMAADNLSQITMKLEKDEENRQFLVVITQEANSKITRTQKTEITIFKEPVFPMINIQDSYFSCFLPIKDLANMLEIAYKDQMNRKFTIRLRTYKEFNKMDLTLKLQSNDGIDTGSLKIKYKEIPLKTLKMEEDFLKKYEIVTTDLLKQLHTICQLGQECFIGVLNQDSMLCFSFGDQVPVKSQEEEFNDVKLLSIRSFIVPEQNFILDYQIQEQQQQNQEDKVQSKENNMENLVYKKEPNEQELSGIKSQINNIDEILNSLQSYK